LISHLKDTTSLVYLLFLWDKGQFDVLISSDLWLQAVCVVSAVDKSSKTTRRRPADHGHAPALCPFGPWVAKGSGLSMVGVVPMICEFSEQQYIAVMNGGITSRLMLGTTMYIGWKNIIIHSGYRSVEYSYASVVVVA
jgi:hypothetical protein